MRKSPKEKRNDRTKPLKKLIKFVLKREKQKNVVLKQKENRSKQRFKPERL